MRPSKLHGRATTSLPAACRAIAAAHRGPTYLLIAVAVGAMLSGCQPRPGAQLIDDAMRQTDNMLQNADTLPSGAMRLKAPGLPPMEVPPSTADDLDSLVGQATEDLLSSTAQQSDESRLLDTVQAACAAKDIAESGAARTWEEAASKALVNFGGQATREERVAALAEELEETESRGDEVGLIAVYVMCESTG